MPEETETKKANIKLHAIEAEYYDKIHPEIFNCFEQRSLNKRFELATKDIKNKRTCLDLGCGTGNLVSKEIKVFDSVIGLDISREMLKACRDKFPKKKKLSLILGDSEHIPLRYACIDFVSIFSVLHHLPSPFTALKEIFRILNNSGRAYIDHEPNSTKKRASFLTLELLMFQSQKVLRKLFKTEKLLFPLDYSKTDIWNFRSQDLCLTLKTIGFSEIKVSYHFLYSQYFHDLPFPLKCLSHLDRLLDRIYIVKGSSHTLTITMRKTS